VLSGVHSNLHGLVHRRNNELQGTSAAAATYSRIFCSGNALSDVNELDRIHDHKAAEFDLVEAQHQAYRCGSDLQVWFYAPVARVVSPDG
jgi:hypothetical protein